jgi:hypothetical protein
MPAAMSESKPPHLPSTRTGMTRAPQATPAMPTPLLPAAATMLDTRVPCQELLPAPQSLKVPEAFSSVVIQSPGSAGSPSRPSPSLA